MIGQVTLGSLAARGVLDFGDGYRTKRSEHGTPGYRILRVADIGEGTISAHGPDFVSAEYADKINSKLSEPGDVLLTTKGTVGRVARVPDGLEPLVYSPQLCYFRVREPDRLNARYLSYWFRSNEFLRQAAHRANNTDMAAYINLADIRSLELRLPGIDEQRAIAEVLGALDDKIAANTYLVNTSLQLADAQFVDAAAHSMLSDLTFADVADVGGGGTPKTKVEEYWGDEVNWATPTDVTALHGPYLRSTSRRITEAGLDNCSSALYPTGSVLMTSRATIGAFAVAQAPMAVNQGFIVVNSKGDVPQWWLFHEMRRRVPEFVSHANGATFLELSRGKFKNFHVHLAATDVMQRFAETADALHKRAAAAEAESASLAATRDALLPLLMSGKVTVRDAESIVEGVA